MSCPRCPGPTVPHHCGKKSSVMDRISALGRRPCTSRNSLGLGQQRRCAPWNVSPLPGGHSPPPRPTPATVPSPAPPVAEKPPSAWSGAGTAAATLKSKSPTGASTAPSWRPTLRHSLEGSSDAAASASVAGSTASADATSPRAASSLDESGAWGEVPSAEQAPRESMSVEGAGGEVPLAAEAAGEDVGRDTGQATKEEQAEALQDVGEKCEANEKDCFDDAGCSSDAAARVDADACKRALSKWLMEDSSPQDMKALSRGKPDALAAAVAKGVNTTQCIATDLPSIKVSLGDHGVNGEVVLGWHADDPSCLLWSFHEREAELKAAFRKAPNSPSNLYFICKAGAGHMFLCRFALGMLAFGNGDQYYVMSSPPEVSPIFMVRSLASLGPSSLCPVLDPVLPCPMPARKTGV